MALRVYVDAAKTRLRFDELPETSLDALEGAANELEQALLARAQGLASGTVLQVKSGKYVGSIKGRVKRSKSGVYGQIGSRDPRADLFEFGGKTGPHDIEASNARALVMQIKGGTVFARSVHHPGGDYGRTQMGSAGSRGKYSVIFAAYDAMRAEIFTKLNEAGTRGIEKE